MEDDGSERVVYRRKNPGQGVAFAEVLVVPTKAEMDQKESKRTYVGRQECDFLVRRAALAAAFGEEIVPAMGDRIEMPATCETAAVVFELAPRGDEPHARWSDEFRRIRWRLHGQLVKAA